MACNFADSYGFLPSFRGLDALPSIKCADMLALWLTSASIQQDLSSKSGACRVVSAQCGAVGLLNNPRHVEGPKPAPTITIQDGNITKLFSVTVTRAAQDVACATTNKQDIAPAIHLYQCGCVPMARARCYASWLQLVPRPIVNPKELNGRKLHLGILRMSPKYHHSTLRVLTRRQEPPWYVCCSMCCSRCGCVRVWAFFGATPHDATCAIVLAFGQ
mmetsp:Transcript_22787/g.52059  ORF Transcript_22787/g.52059 Transcript_22787/m.52059 type:complete len:217 (+) Transcript_22787:571-1221(+)